MKRIALFSFCILLSVLMTKISAQEMSITTLRIGYINSTDLLNSMPEKKEATAVLEDLNNKYKTELKFMQNDYNKKYSDFITFQNSMGDNIKLRRMQELYELEKNINDFIKVAQNDVDVQEKRLVEPLRDKLNKAIAEVGLENNMTCIYDKAAPSVAFISPQAIDLNELVKQKLNSAK
ncbi:MAG: OmpH family outer membrane protein [Dysgonamonadaceae bacterium]